MQYNPSGWVILRMPMPLRMLSSMNLSFLLIPSEMVVINTSKSSQFYSLTPLCINVQSDIFILTVVSQNIYRASKDGWIIPHARLLWLKMGARTYFCALDKMESVNQWVNETINRMVQISAWYFQQWSLWWFWNQLVWMRFGKRWENTWVGGAS